MKLESRFYDLVPFKDFERVFGKIKIMEVSMKASGKIKFIKTTDTRRAILLDSDERWFGIFSNTKGFAGANEVVKNIDENLSKGDYVEMEVVKTDKGFWNIRSVERVDDYSEGKEESPPDEEEQHEEESLYTAKEPMAKKTAVKETHQTADYARQAMIVSQSSGYQAIATVEHYDLSGAPEDVDAHIDRLWEKYFKRTMKLA